MAGTPNDLDWSKLMEEALTVPGDLGRTYRRFHSYSVANQMLFHMQGMHEPVASYSRWKALGRQVVRGSKAKEVIVPVKVNVNVPSEETPEQEPVAKKRERVARLVGFKVVKAVFGLSDTEGPEIPEAPIPGWDLQTALGKLGITEVPFQHTNGNIQGHSNGMEFAVSPVAKNRTKTVFHEVGHIVLGHTAEDQIQEYQMHRGLLEFQAESTAYLVMNELGVMDDETASISRGYIAHWLHGENPPDTAIRQVFSAAERILAAGRVEPEVSE